ncbi:MAG: hypothetical protein E6J52_13040 [Chloroflexi bacterium]|nr:MAG: hypothetical protein E6J52_13040 [Chloroflexota bacterium]
MQQEITPIAVRPWTLNGISERMLVSHYENNYGGAVRTLNAVRADLAALDAGAPGYRLRALKREEIIAMGSVTLHELYFGNLGGEGNKVPDHAVDAAPVLVLDMYEHAYHMDFGANATAYIDAFMRNIEWAAVIHRMDAVRADRSLPLEDPSDKSLPSLSVEELAAQLAKGEPVQVLDARPRHHISRTVDLMEGAIWRDPDRVDEWIGELAVDRPVAVYCAYGFHVGCSVTKTLRERGFDARYIRGGISAWYATGGSRALRPDAG